MAYGDGSVSFNAQTGRYIIRVDLGHAADGRRQRKTKYSPGPCTPENDAKAWKVCKALTAKVSRGQVLTTGAPLLASYLEDWFATYHDEWAPSTQRAYRHAIDYWIVPTLGRMKVEALTKLDVQRWLSEHKKEHGARRRIGLAHAVLRSALSGAVRLNMVTLNAADKLKVPAPPKPVGITRYLTVEQAKQFLAAAGAHHLAALFTVALACGLRLGEACGLAWADVAAPLGTNTKLAPGQIHIRQQLQRVAKGKLVLRALKTVKSNRVLTLPAFALAALQAHRKQQLQDRLKAGDRWVDTGLVFTTYDSRGTRYKAGNPLGPRNVARVLDVLLVKAGLPRAVTFHGLRHSAASLLIAAGVPLVEVSLLLGHSEIRVTSDHYGHLQASTAAKAATRMDGIFS
jgi:integrase